MSPLKQVVEGLLEAASTISATVAFMSMTINRAIDFTKASHEMCLVPTFETIDLLTALAWPVRIMRTLQRRIEVVVQPLPPSLCPFIIADKGWLTENLLCLISNAIKYSHEGSISIRCSLQLENNTSTHSLTAAAGENDDKVN